MKRLLAITTCDKPQYVERAEAQRATWATARPDVDIRFFTGPMLGVPDDYESLPLKVQAIFRWALAEGYDYVAKMDDDVWCNVERLLAMEVAPHDYVGNTRAASGKWQAPYCSGYCYWLSRRAMEIIVAAPVTDDFEDRWVGNTLAAAGVYPMKDVYHIRALCGGIANPEIIWSRNSALGYAAVLGELTPQLIYSAHDAFRRLYPLYCRMHPKPEVKLTPYLI